jgi:hypothetical protein
VGGIAVLIFFREPSELKMTVPGKGKNLMFWKYNKIFYIESVPPKVGDSRARMTLMEVCRLPYV